MGIAAYRQQLVEIARLVQAEDAPWPELLMPASRRDRALLVTFVNPLAVKIGAADQHYAEMLRRFDQVFADGMLLARMAGLVTARSTARLSFDGNSVGGDILRLCGARALSVCLVGGRPGVGERAGAVYARDYGVRIAGTRHGYFASDAEMQAYAGELAVAAPDVVICGMGAPRQEQFLLALQEAGWHGQAFTCGGYLDQAAEGKAQYYPEWVNRLHLRAFYRVYKEPRRLLVRYLVDYLPFFLGAGLAMVSR